MHLVVVENGAPVVRLLAWGLQEEGFQVEACLLDNASGCIRDMAEKPAVALLNMTADIEAKRRCVATLRAAAAPLVIDLCALPGEDCTADACVDSPYRLTTIVAAIKDLLAG